MHCSNGNTFEGFKEEFTEKKKRSVQIKNLIAYSYENNCNLLDDTPSSKTSGATSASLSNKKRKFRSEDDNDSSTFEEHEEKKKSLMQNGKHNLQLYEDNFNPLSETPRSNTPALIIRNTDKATLTEEELMTKCSVKTYFATSKEEKKLILKKAASILNDVKNVGKRFESVITIKELVKFSKLAFNMDQMNVMKTFFKLHYRYKNTRCLLKALHESGCKDPKIYQQTKKTFRRQRFNLRKYLEFIQDLQIFKKGKLLPSQNRQEVRSYFLIVVINSSYR